jgi:hypothetical protein
VATSVPHDLLDSLRDRLRIHSEAAAFIVVFDAALAQLLFGERDVEVEIEIAAMRGGPGKRPAHSLLVGLQLRERRPRHHRECDIVVFQMQRDTIESIRDRRAGRTPGLVVRPKHEVVDEELRAPVEHILQRLVALLGVERINLIDSYPGQLLSQPRNVVAAPRQVLLGGKQIASRVQPSLACCCHMCRHHASPLMAQCCSKHSSSGLPDLDREIDLLPATGGRE